MLFKLLCLILDKAPSQAPDQTSYALAIDETVKRTLRCDLRKVKDVAKDLGRKLKSLGLDRPPVGYRDESPHPLVVLSAASITVHRGRLS